MDYRLLKYFKAIAEEKSISRAASVLHITQPTLSRQLKEFEDELGAALFYREKKEMHLTEAGLFLKDRADEIIDLTEQTEKEFIRHKEILFSGHIAIGCVEAENSDTLALILEELVTDYPQITFTIFSGTSNDITDKLDKGLLDLAILLEPIKTNKYEKIRLPRKEKWGLLVSESSMLAKKQYVEPADLTAMPLLCSGRREIKNMLQVWSGNQFEHIRIIGTYNLIFNIIPLIDNGVAHALAIKGAVTDWNSRGIKFLPLQPAIETECIVTWKKHRALTPVVNEFIKRIKYAFQAYK